jgi:uncharacterized membrane protein
MIPLFILLFCVFYVLFLPGYAIIRASSIQIEKGGRFILGLALSLILVPILSFGAAMLLRTFIHTALLLCVATTINACCLIVYFAKKRDK